MSAAVPPPDAPPRARRAASAVLGLLAIVTTSAVSISVDRALHERDDRGRGDHERHDGHDSHVDPGAGDGRSHDDAAEHRDAGSSHADGEAAKGDHRPHVDVAVVRLTEAQRAHADLELETAAPGRVDEVLTLPGEVAFDEGRVAHVSPRTEGSVREVRVGLGDRVHEGDLLAVLESREVAAMQQELLAARARRELAEASFRRVEPLHQSGVVSDRDLLAARQALAEARIDESSAAQKLAAGAGPRATGAGLALVAPIDGEIVDKHVTIGEVLGQGTQAFTIADLSRLWVWGTAHARELSRVRKGQRAYVRAEGTPTPLVGAVDYVEARLGERTRTARARVVLDAPPEGLRPGAFVTAELVVGEVDAAVVVVDAAIQRIGDHPVVFVEHDGAFEARPVETGLTGRTPEGRLVRAVEAGLRPGDRYVTKNAFTLKAELGKGTAGHEH